MKPTSAKQLLSQLGARVSDPDLNAELCFALGEETAGARIQEILESDSARARPSAALRLAIESRMPAVDVIRMLQNLPVENDQGDSADSSAICSKSRLFAASGSHCIDSNKGRAA